MATTFSIPHDAKARMEMLVRCQNAALPARENKETDSDVVGKSCEPKLCSITERETFVRQTE